MEQKLIVLIIAGTMFAQSYAQEIKGNPDGSVSITITKEQAEECKKGGGCTLISMQMIEALVIESARYMCGKKI